MITYRYEDNGEVMRLHRIDSEYPQALNTTFCAIGSYEPWPQKLSSPTWVHVAIGAAERQEKRRKNML